MAADKTIKALIKQIEGAIDSFGKSIPSIQKGLLDQLTIELKDLQLNNGKILNSVQNLRLIGSIKNKIERLLISQQYKDSVKDFVKSFDTVADLQKQYFAQFNKKFKAPKTLEIIRELSVDKTLNDLVGQGLQANVVDRLGKVLTDNIISGGSYASLNNQVREFLEGNEGALVRYSRTITTDAINQYNAQYHDAIAQDLKFDWGRYVGSNLTTTREFCELLTEKEWVHRSELPKIIKGEIDGVQCKVSKAGLPLGMIPGTDVDNFKVRRGGYNCGHQFFWVPDSAVPDAIKNKQPVTKPAGIKQKPPPAPKPKPVPVSPHINASELKKYPFEINPKAFSLLEQPTTLKLKSKGSYYDPVNHVLHIAQDQRFQGSKYHRDSVIYHELGHATHIQKKIITSNSVTPEFQKLFKDLQDEIGKDASVIHDSIFYDMVGRIVKKEPGLAQKYGVENDKDVIEGVSVVADLLGALTFGQYGKGHSVQYYRTNKGAYAEVFAHGNSFYFTDNKFMDELMPGVKKLLQDYFKKLYGD